MPVPTLIDPLRILPTSDAMSLSHDINRTLDKITQHLSNRYGFTGPVKFYNGVDLGQNGINNVGTSTTPSNAATVEQLAQLNAKVEAQGIAIAGIAFRPAPATAFVLLSDAPPGGFAGAALKGVRVRADEAALEYVALVTSLLGLSDIPDSYVGQAHKILRVRPDETGMDFVTGTGGSDNFLSLLDTPDSYAGQSGKVLAVNGTETALVYVDPSGGSVTFPIAIPQGGTGATTVPGAQTALGLVPGTTIQSYDALLAAIAALTTSANTMPYFTGADTVGTTALTATARTFLSNATIGDMRTQLGLQALALLNTVGTPQIDNGAVTFATMQNVNNQRLMGRSNSVAGPPHEIAVGTGLALAGGVLSATGSGGGGTTPASPDRSRKRLFMHMGS